MTVTNATIAAGNNYHFGGLLNDNGVLVGTSDPTAGNQDGSPMFRMLGAKSSPLQPNEPDFVTQTGDDQPMAQWQFDPTENPSGVLTYAVVDLDQEAIFQNTKTFEFAGGKGGVRQPADTSRADICLIHQARAKSADNTTYGASRWYVHLYLKATASPLGGTLEERTPMDNQISVSVNNSEAFPWGATLQEAIEGTERATQIPYNFDDPITIHTHKGDGAETIFNVAYTPTADADIEILINGVKTTDWTRSGKAITFGTAPPSDQYIHTVYQFDTSA